MFYCYFGEPDQLIHTTYKVCGAGLAANLEEIKVDDGAIYQAVLGWHDNLKRLRHGCNRKGGVTSQFPIDPDILWRISL